MSKLQSETISDAQYLPATQATQLAAFSIRFPFPPLMQRAVCVCSLLNARQAWPCLQPAWNNITKTDGLSWLNCVGRVSLRQEQAKQTNVGCWVQTILTWSVETVGNKWLKGWENGLPMPSRIATAFEAILGNSLKYKAPDFSNHFTTKGGPSSVVFSKGQCYVQSHANKSTGSFTILQYWHSGSIKHLFKIHLSLIKKINVSLHVRWALPQ